MKSDLPDSTLAHLSDPKLAIGKAMTTKLATPPCSIVKQPKGT